MQRHAGRVGGNALFVSSLKAGMQPFARTNGPKRRSCSRNGELIDFRALLRRRTALTKVAVVLDFELVFAG